MANILGFCNVRLHKESLVISCEKIVLLVFATRVCTTPQICLEDITNDMTTTDLVQADEVTLSAAKKGGDRETMAQIELSQEAQKRIQKNIELRRRASKFVKVLDKETRTFKFFPDETESHISEKYGELRFAYTVIEKGNNIKQIWEVSRTTSGQIDDLFMDKHTILTVHRIGSDKRTVYEIYPASESEIEELELRLKELDELEGEE